MFRVGVARRWGLVLTLAALLTACGLGERRCTQMGAVGRLKLDISAVRAERPVVAARACVAGRCDVDERVTDGKASFPDGFSIKLTPAVVATEFRLLDGAGRVLRVATGSVVGVPRVEEPNGPGCGKQTVLVADVVAQPDGQTYEQTGLETDH